MKEIRNEVIKLLIEVYTDPYLQSNYRGSTKTDYYLEMSILSIPLSVTLKRSIYSFWAASTKFKLARIVPLVKNSIIEYLKCLYIERILHGGEKI